MAEPTAPAAAPAASSEAAASGEQPASSSSGGGGVVATAGDALEDHLASSEAFREYRKSFAARQSISADRPARKSFAALYGEERQWGAQERKSIAAKRESVHIKADWSENGSEDEEEEAHGGVESGVALAIPQKSEETPVAGHEAGGPSDGGPSEEVLAPAPSAASSPKGRGGIFSMLRRKQTEPTEEPEEVAEEAAEETPAQKSRRERLERLAKLEEAQRVATEVQRKAAEELRLREAEEQQVAEEEAAAVSAGGGPGGGRRRRSTWFGTRKASTSSATSSTCSPCRTESPQEPAEPPPRWYTLLVTYREQKAEIEGWLETEPTEEEMADGSALQKAFTLMTARDELQAKIEQLEAIAAQERMDEGSGGPPRLAGRVRRGSSVTGVI